MAFTGLTTLILALPFLYLAKRILAFSHHYRAAKRTGIPIYVQPFNAISPIWILFGKALTWLFAEWEWVHRINNGWMQFTKLKPYERFGTRAFWVVTPDGKDLLVADPPACIDVLRRCRSEFQKNPEQYNLLDIYGVSVVTANGRLWERHRRITTPPFNESVSETVWNETAQQADEARRAWMEESAGAGVGVDGERQDVRTTQHDTTGIAFNVLSAAGFGIPFSFDDVVGERPGKGERGRKKKIVGSVGGGAANHNDDVLDDLKEKDPLQHALLRYRETLSLLLTNIGELLVVEILHRIGWPKFAMWGIIKVMSDATTEYGVALQRIIKEERQAIEDGPSGSLGEAEKEKGSKKKKVENLMSALIRGSDQSGDNDASSGLSDEEVAGNLFVFNLAGHDTTANALNFAITLLALEPKWQEWLAQEIDSVVQEDQSGLKYAAVFPKLQRCLAIMYETLRLFGPVPSTPRWTAQSYHTLTIEGKKYQIPPDSDIRLDLASLHHDKRTWGEDAEEFHPDRWIPKNNATTTNNSSPLHPLEHLQSKRTQPQQPSPYSSAAGATTEGGGAANGSYDWQSESLISPTPGSFIPWTAGPRVCPGKKFSQVEFTSAMLRFFQGGARVRIVQEDGETEEEARARADRIVHDPHVGLTLRMKNSDRIGLKWYIKSE